MESTTMTAEVQVIFKTLLPEDYQVPDIQININTGSTNKELTQVLYLHIIIHLDSQKIDRVRGQGLK
jgi:hypothetical protein